MTIKEQLAKALKRIEELEKKVSDLEARPIVIGKREPTVHPWQVNPFMAPPYRLGGTGQYPEHPPTTYCHSGPAHLGRSV